MSTHTRVLSVSLPEEMANQVEALAKNEHRTISELFREAFRRYRALRAQQAFTQLDHIAATNSEDASGYTDRDIERLVAEARESLETQRKPKRDSAKRR